MNGSSDGPPRRLSRRALFEWGYSRAVAALLTGGTIGLASCRQPHGTESHPPDVARRRPPGRDASTPYYVGPGDAAVPGERDAATAPLDGGPPRAQDGGYNDYNDYSNGYSEYYSNYSEYYNDYNNYYDYGDYSNSYSEYLNYSNYNDYNDYSDYNDTYSNYSDYSDYSNYSA